MSVSRPNNIEKGACSSYVCPNDVTIDLSDVCATNGDHLPTIIVTATIATTQHTSSRGCVRLVAEWQTGVPTVDDITTASPKALVLAFTSFINGGWIDDFATAR